MENLITYANEVSTGRNTTVSAIRDCANILGGFANREVSHARGVEASLKFYGDDGYDRTKSVRLFKNGNYHVANTIKKHK